MLRNAILQLHDQTGLVFSRLESLGCEQQSTLFSASGVGRHLRHMHDHERALQAGLASGVVDYNHRHRDDPGEHNFSLALDTTGKLRDIWLNAELSDRPVELRSEISITACEILVLQSTLWRELTYMIHHNIHHLAYIKLLLDRQHIRLPDAVGQAPATASYYRQLERTEG